MRKQYWRHALRPFMFALVLGWGLAGQAADTYTVDPTHSAAEFKVRHLGVSSVSGRFNEFSGEVTLDGADESKNSVTFEIKTSSVDTGNEGRDKHLQNTDFFNVEKYPAMTFKSTSFKKKGENTYEVTGDFTLLGVTKPITVEVEQTGTGKNPDGKDLIGFETNFRIKRSEYGMTYSPTMIGDEVRIAVMVECVKK